MKMDKRQRVIRVVKGVLTVSLIIFILCAWPGYLVYDEDVSVTDSARYEPTDVLTPGDVAAQYFVPQRSHMSGIGFAILFDEANAGDETIRFVLCEESGQEIFSRDIMLGQMESGWYYRVKIDRQLKAGETYCWKLAVPDAEDLDLQIMYTNHLTDQAAENTLFLLNDGEYGDYGDITQSVSQYIYRRHPDKIIIIGEYWTGAVLIYIICMDIVSRFSKPRQAGAL